MRATRDAVLTRDALDAAVGLDQRWPEPRLLDQTDVFYLWDRTRMDLDGLAQRDLAWLLGYLRENAAAWHAAAVADERHTTSTALRWALEQAGVPLVESLDERDWLRAPGSCARSWSGPQSPRSWGAPRSPRFSASADSVSKQLGQPSRAPFLADTVVIGHPP